ncbi:uncharacterized protein EAE98_005190 [Botrytis deweyae]|uniref:Uncharacterized protein n=1 Tax=Botrytis deweyae TaxID=2478750 RepID=A0ABQ7IN62_9HELO|nr:uncharacterized protein EAE98_005190 [Botrytis deweyae]KAF7929271.1 hypothetical protein EAE98_005190 [Botrytis deweyae]
MRCRLPRLLLKPPVLGLQFSGMPCCPDGSVNKIVERCIKLMPRDVEHGLHGFAVDLPRRRADHGEISGKAISHQPSATLREKGDVRTLESWDRELDSGLGKKEEVSG